MAMAPRTDGGLKKPGATPQWVCEAPRCNPTAAGRKEKPDNRRPESMVDLRWTATTTLRSAHPTPQRLHVGCVPFLGRSRPDVARLRMRLQQKFPKKSPPATALVSEALPTSRAPPDRLGTHLGPTVQRWNVDHALYPGGSLPHSTGWAGPTVQRREVSGLRLG
ncbi:hypothetical protein WOLCODRAFT_159562 [Wolfiporia cocos MD-104 SS10]|uniref:Uncharacterized protein n=1 Tax=Wolfiporia cocos (strain MD-104) TaxID=742152 RepID=A0A2H3JJN8_WOLCO|nr:hypothetical protein WOLCODRAFT_159562 [Wolfiporia cocos MD-104 SS10]